MTEYIELSKKENNEDIGSLKMIRTASIFSILVNIFIIIYGKDSLNEIGWAFCILFSVISILGLLGVYKNLNRSIKRLLTSIITINIVIGIILLFILFIFNTI